MSLRVNAHDPGYSHKYDCAVTNTSGLAVAGYDINADAVPSSPPLNQTQQKALEGIYDRYFRVCKLGVCTKLQEVVGQQPIEA